MRYDESWHPAVLITGADGYIGTALHQFLSDKVRTLDRFPHDVRDWNAWESLEDAHYDWVLHFAGLNNVPESFNSPDEFLDVNVFGTDNAFRYANDHADGIIYASSLLANDWSKSPYAMTKRMTEVLQEMHSGNAIGVRIGTIWPGKPSSFYNKVLNDEIEEVEGLDSRDFIHVDDVVSAIWTIMTNTEQEMPRGMDIGSGVAITLNEICVALDKEVKVNMGGTPQIQADISWLTERGWKPQNHIMNWSAIPDLEKTGIGQAKGITNIRVEEYMKETYASAGYDSPHGFFAPKDIEYNKKGQRITGHTETTGKKRNWNRDGDE